MGGWALAHAISAWLAASTGVALQPSLGAVEGLMALAVLGVGLMLATLPAWRVQRMDVAAAMKAH